MENNIDQKTEIANLLALLLNDIYWLSISSVGENHIDELKRMSKVIGLIISAFDNNPINAKQIATLLYDKELSAGLLDLSLFN